jgi:hypothetical protein
MHLVVAVAADVVAPNTRVAAAAAIAAPITRASVDAPAWSVRNKIRDSSSV